MYQDPCGSITMRGWKIPPSMNLIAIIIRPALKVGTGFIAAQGKKHLYIVTASQVVEEEAEVLPTIQVTFFTHQEETFAADPSRQVLGFGGRCAQDAP